jgi:hypothetical protein
MAKPKGTKSPAQRFAEGETTKEEYAKERRASREEFAGAMRRESEAVKKRQAQRAELGKELASKTERKLLGKELASHVETRTHGATFGEGQTTTTGRAPNEEEKQALVKQWVSAAKSGDMEALDDAMGGLTRAPGAYTEAKAQVEKALGRESPSKEEKRAIMNAKLGGGFKTAGGAIGGEAQARKLYAAAEQKLKAQRRQEGADYYDINETDILNEAIEDARDAGILTRELEDRLEAAASPRGAEASEEDYYTEMARESLSKDVDAGTAEAKVLSDPDAIRQRALDLADRDGTPIDDALLDESVGTTLGAKAGDTERNKAYLEQAYADIIEERVDLGEDLDEDENPIEPTKDEIISRAEELAMDDGVEVSDGAFADDTGALYDKLSKEKGLTGPLSAHYEGGAAKGEADEQQRAKEVAADFTERARDSLAKDMNVEGVSDPEQVKQRALDLADKEGAVIDTDALDESVEDSLMRDTAEEYEEHETPEGRKAQERRAEEAELKVTKTLPKAEKLRAFAEEHGGKPKMDPETAKKIAKEGGIQSVETGPRGGIFYITKSGKKIYKKR